MSGPTKRRLVDVDGFDVGESDFDASVQVEVPESLVEHDAHHAAPPESRHQLRARRRAALRSYEREEREA